MAEPVGEDAWLAFLDEASRTANAIDGRVAVVEQYKVREPPIRPLKTSIVLI